MSWSLLSHAGAGLLAGLLCALGGAVKDAPHEGFHPRTFVRSPLVATAMGLLTVLFAPSLLLAFVAAGYLERVGVEGWKILTRKVPGKFLWYGVRP